MDVASTEKRKSPKKAAKVPEYLIYEIVEGLTLTLSDLNVEKPKA